MLSPAEVALEDMQAKYTALTDALRQNPPDAKGLQLQLQGVVGSRVNKVSGMSSLQEKKTMFVLDVITGLTWKCFEPFPKSSKCCLATCESRMIYCSLLYVMCQGPSIVASTFLSNPEKIRGDKTLLKMKHTFRDLMRGWVFNTHPFPPPPPPPPVLWTS